jgi:hypothetical protein
MKKDVSGTTRFHHGKAMNDGFASIFRSMGYGAIHVAPPGRCDSHRCRPVDSTKGEDVDGLDAGFG